MTIKPNKDTYLHICYDKKGRSHRGEIMHKNPYEPICEFLEEAIEDESEGIAFYEEFRKAADRAGLKTLAEYIQQTMDDEAEHLALMLAFRKQMCDKRR